MEHECHPLHHSRRLNVKKKQTTFSNSPSCSPGVSRSVRNQNTFPSSTKTLFKFQHPLLVWNVSMFNTTLMMPPLQTSPLRNHGDQPFVS